MYYILTPVNTGHYLRLREHPTNPTGGFDCRHSARHHADKRLTEFHIIRADRIVAVQDRYFCENN